MSKSYFKSAWERCEQTMKMPTRARNVIILDFEDFKENVLNEEKKFVEKITDSLFSGDCYILKNAFPRKFMLDVKEKTFLYFKDKPSEFYKMLEGSPDFHRKIDIELGKKYSFNMCKHSFYFYPWNKDPINLFEIIYQRWRIIKKLMGLNPKEYEKNTPKDGVVDRVQVVQYPSQIGFLEPHSDPYKYQRLFFSGYMSKKGEDFNGLGFYLVGEGNKVINIEDSIDIGDIGIGYATVYHGVAPVNIDKKPNWEDLNDGRWFLSMYSNQSDEVKSRHTGYAVTEKLALEGVLPEIK
tara:strand:+ start:552 stop:1436 length:885 start_codon:yes stop_codon:yes gene_type:complete